MKTLIRGAVIYDGSGELPVRGDVLIHGEQIAAVGALTPDGDTQVVEAEGMALSPGFINTHSHMELEIIKHPELRSVVEQGITTEVLGQDGSSVAPLTDELVQELADNMAPLAGVLEEPYSWRSFAQYMEKVEQSHAAARHVSLVGHGTVRMNVMGNDNRQATPQELEQICQIIARCMEEGAKGVSFGLIYPPGSYGNTDELCQVAKVVARYDGLIMVHMRNEQDRILESIDEMAQVVRASGVRLQISHLKLLGYRNWGKSKIVLEKIRQLREEGYDVTFDQYPWTAACTGLKVVVPMWAYDGGEQGFQNRLNDPEEYAKILEETEQLIEARGGGEAVLIAATATAEYAWMNGMNLADICKKMGMTRAQAALAILKHEGPSVVAIYFSINEDDVVNIMQSPWHCVCTDGIMGAHPHPRTYASFPRFLGHYVRDLGLMPLQTAIHKITMEPARRLRLWDRGLIRVGLSADLVLFDPATVGEKNSYLEPEVPPAGILGVWVKGARKK